MSALDVVFDYSGQQVRTLLIDGEPWFVAADVARILGYRDAHNLTRRLDEDERGTHVASTPGGEQMVTTISESGLYAAVIGSQIDGAKPFKRWVTGTVLPAIRKTGSYSAQPELTREQRLAQAVLESAEVIKELDAKVASLTAPAAAWTHMVAAEGDYSVSDAAKTLSRDPEISIGRDLVVRLYGGPRLDLPLGSAPLVEGVPGAGRQRPPGREAVAIRVAGDDPRHHQGPRRAASGTRAGAPSGQHRLTNRAGSRRRRPAPASRWAVSVTSPSTEAVRRITPRNRPLTLPPGNGSQRPGQQKGYPNVELQAR